jgi:chromosome segregation ATPase
MKETQRNFDRCVASSIYKDPSLSREIKTNEEYINKNKKEIKDNASKGVNALDDMKEKWEKDIDEKDMKVQNIKSDVSSIFSKQNYIHSEVANATLKMFKVLQNILIYIKDIVMFKISRAKNNLNMNKTHLEYMDEYKDAYVDYDKAYDNLKKMDYVTAINSARKSIKKFEELSKKLDKFMDDHYVDIVEMTDGCYNLEYNLSDKSCDTLFPTLNRDIINYYPLIKDSL